MKLPAWRLILTYVFILLGLLILKPDIIKIVATLIQAA